MDWLLVFVLVAIVGQFVFLKWVGWRQGTNTAQLAKARADLLEAAARQQLDSYATHRDTLEKSTKGLGGE